MHANISVQALGAVGIGLLLTLQPGISSSSWLCVPPLYGSGLLW